MKVARIKGHETSYQIPNVTRLDSVIFKLTASNGIGQGKYGELYKATINKRGEWLSSNHMI